MPIVMGLDCETRSRIDLKKCGADVYAHDESTEVICCSFIRKDTGAEWLWFAGQPMPEALAETLLAADEIEAHNARFDQLIYECVMVNDHNFPPLPVSKWVCTAAQCRVNALPANLDGATRAANAQHKKDHGGMALIRQLSIPNKKTGEFNYSLKLIADMGRYCMQDSRAMVSLANGLRPLSDQDKIDWQINERINDRGILIDIELATLAQQYAEQEKIEIGTKLFTLTDGAIEKATQTARLLKTLRVEFADNPAFMSCIKKPLGKGETEQKYTLDKAARSQLLNLEDLPPYWREVLELVDQGGNSSVSKFSGMLNRADPDTGRVHGALIFAGAGQTQRYSSKGLQLHNMRRDCWGDYQTEVFKALMRRGQPLVKPVMDTLAKLLRPAIIPEAGKQFVVGDWSAIEARVLPWLANSTGGDSVLDVFRSGRDIYVETAARMYLHDRQIGKVAALSLGFGGAVGAFQAMATNYGVELTDSETQRIVTRWRMANKWAPRFWSELEGATVKALRKPHTVFTAGRIRYVYISELLGGTLMCILPNDTVIQYPYARLERGSVTCMKASVQPKSDSEDEWPRMSLWGGFLAENVTQATASCLLRELLQDMVQDKFPVVLHVHDEVVLEVPAAESEKWAEDVQAYMEMVPEWALGLPLTAAPVIMNRYGK